MSLSIGDRIPAIAGAAADGRFYSLDLQAGRPAVLIALGALEASEARAVLGWIALAEPEVTAAGGDIVALAPVTAPFGPVLNGEPQARARIVYAVEAAGLDTAQLDGHPAAVAIDRAGRIVELAPLREPGDIAALFARARARMPDGPGRLCAAAAPVLIVPNLASADFCQRAIAHFEASPHDMGVMASHADGQAQAKLDLGKKHRRDIELTPGAPIHDEALALIAGRCAPEVKRAFQRDITFADRILIARYDDTGGYFRRHRDNGAPHTAFREFALSLNLNTQDYEGGELLFPEYDDNRYSPPAGSAILFSASLLHEAAPVTKGSRYVLLSFLCGATSSS